MKFCTACPAAPFIRLSIALIAISVPGCPEGTTITVRELFFNTPARLKFLKADFTESLHITNIIQGLAIANPEIGMTLKKDGKTITGPLPKKQTVLQRIASLFGSNISSAQKVLEDKKRS